MNNLARDGKLPFSRKIYVAFGAAILALLVLFAISDRALVVSRDSEGWLRHSHEVLEVLQDLLLDMENLESSSGGFALTGQEVRLESYSTNLLSLKLHAAAFGSLTVDNPAQQRRIPLLEGLIARQIQFGELVIALRRSEGSVAAANAIQDGKDRRVMDEFRGIVRDAREEEFRLLEIRRADVRRRLGYNEMLMTLATVLGLLIAAAAAWSLQRESSKRGFAEKALLESEEKYRGLLEAAPDAMVVVNRGGVIVLLNVQAEHQFGYRSYELVGQIVRNIIPEGFAERLLADALRPAEDALAQQIGTGIELYGRRKDGSGFPIEIMLSPLESAEGLLVTAAIRNITTRKKAEALLVQKVEELDRSNEELVESAHAARRMTLQMTHLAEHDALTGLPNRLLLNDRIGQAVKLAKRNMCQVAVLFLDVDGFKHINDSLGHVNGDKLLQSIAARLIDCLRAPDTVSRLGGDEFLVLLPVVRQSEDAAITARRLLQALAKGHFIGGHDLQVTASIGVSVYPDDGLDAETLIKNADTAMYQAKENGHHSYQFFKPVMNVRAVERQSIEEHLRRALERQEFTLHYQPKINIASGFITGVEALIRWNHPTRGSVPPAQFIPVAEDCGFILPIGAWVLRQACAQARAWMDAGLPVITMAVNVSALQFRNEDFLEDLFRILDETRLDPRYLELELTESALMKHPELAASLLSTLRRVGVQVVVDDFGTGYSSLSSLRRFPLDALKIDQSFVGQITTVPRDTAIVRAIINMGRSLNLRVVAEGVETQAQLDFLKLHGCDEAQGYFFSPPVLPEEFRKTARPSAHAIKLE